MATEWNEGNGEEWKEGIHFEPKDGSEITPKQKAEIVESMAERAKMLFNFVSVIDDEAKAIITVLGHDPDHPDWAIRSISGLAKSAKVDLELVKTMLEKYKTEFLPVEEGKVILRAKALGIPFVLVNEIYKLYE